MRRLPSILAPAIALALATSAAHAEPAAQTPASARLMGPVLRVIDAEKELAFYDRVLNARAATTLDHGTVREYMMRFDADPRAAGLILITDSAPSAPRALTAGDAFSRLVLRVSDMDDVTQRLDAGGYAHSPVRDAGHGYRMMMATTPAGYRLELVQAAVVK